MAGQGAQDKDESTRPCKAGCLVAHYFNSSNVVLTFRPFGVRGMSWSSLHESKGFELKP